MKNVNKIWFNVGPYDGLIGYTTRKEARENLTTGETIVPVVLNKNQARTITNALKDAFNGLG